MDAAKALKPSLCLELETIDATACGNHDMPADDCLEGAAVISGDDFSIDDLLDFSNGQLEVEEEEEEKDSLSVSSPDAADDDSNSNSGSFSGNGEDSDSLLGSELAVPVEDIAVELEWVSQFVDDSFPLHQCLPPPPPPSYLMWKPETTTSIVVHRTLPVSLKPPCFPSPVPVKTRSKRSRSGNNKQQPISLSQSTSDTSSTSSWSSSPTRIDLFLKEEETENKKKMKKSVSSSKKVGLAGPIQFQRRCSHCLVQKTPQWRSGPLGPKTLCNACGVRYKSGRLFPEYRPACSPTFAVEIHSNSHRKVLEMRRKKESGLAHMVVSSF